MSTRTSVEINHDAIAALLAADVFMWPRLLVGLRHGEFDEKERQFLADREGRVIGQRHHSESLTITIA